MKVVLDGVDISRYARLTDAKPADSDLAQLVARVELVVGDRSDSLIPKTPRWGQSLELYDDGGYPQTFGGFVRLQEIVDRAGATSQRRWRIMAQDYNVRLIETSTSSLNKSGIVDTDRNFVIAIFRDALKAQTFGTSTGWDDPIITANEPNWPLVRATARFAGADYSYGVTKDQLNKVFELVPNVTLRIRPDKLVEYGAPRARAPFVLHYQPDEPRRRRYLEEVIADTPQGYWRLGEGCNDATAVDASGNAKHGTYSGNPIRKVAGLVDDFDPACSFDGVDDYVTMGDALDQASSFTIECFARPFDVASAHTILAKDDGATAGGWALEQVAGAGFRFVIRGQTPSAVTDSPAAAIARGVYQLAAVWDAPNAMRLLYVNGAEVARTSGITGGPANTALNLTIGARSAGTQPFSGWIDEVAVYGGVLSAARIAAHYAARITRRVGFYDYGEQELVADHRNKMRRGGAAASEATALDEVSYARHRRILADPYKNDTTIPSTVIRQMAYAELRSRRVRRVAAARILANGASAGQVVDVATDRLGTYMKTGPSVDMVLSISVRDSTGVAKNVRSRMLIQQVQRQPMGNRTHEYALQLGDNLPDLATKLATISVAV